MSDFFGLAINHQMTKAGYGSLKKVISKNQKGLTRSVQRRAKKRGERVIKLGLPW